MNWVVIKALYKLYETGDVKLNKTISSSPVFRNHEQAGEIQRNRKSFSVLKGFNEVYEKIYLRNYRTYHTFLEEHGLLKPQLKFEKKDIELLIQFNEGLKDGTLKKLKNDLVEAQESVKGFSLMFYKNEKYLDKHPPIVKAINDIFGIELVDNKSQQYLYVLPCHNPKLIILCENGNFLNRDKLPREYGYELWYAGGKNVPKLEYTDELRRGLPIYYSADWDKDGLEIYQMVRKIIPDIQLLHPDGVSRSIKDTDHKSHWNNPDNPNHISGLIKDFYTEKDKARIKELISKNHWITEEGNNLKIMIDNIK